MGDELAMRSDGSLNLSISPDKHRLIYSYLSICFSKDSKMQGTWALKLSKASCIKEGQIHQVFWNWKKSLSSYLSLRDFLGEF